MKALKGLVISGLALLTFSAFTQSVTAQTFVQPQPLTNKQSFMPPNDMKIDMGVMSLNGIDQASFNQVLDDITAIYAPIIQSMGGQLQMQKLWSDSTVNAEASRNGNIYVVKMYGGMARHPSVTVDAMAMVACHEIGHHIGGAPKMTQPGGFWASVEGQSDYWASLKCLRKLWRNDNNQDIVSRMNVDAHAEKLCHEAFADGNQAALCSRTAMAAMALMGVLAGSSGLPKFDTPDGRRVTRTDENHPQAQCRLDTYFNGALCAVSENTDVNQTSPSVGTCTNRQVPGARPLCWYYESGTPGPTPTPTPTPTPMPTPGQTNTPAINGVTEYRVQDPREQIMFVYDVSNIQGADAAHVEIGLPNTPFPNPNDTRPSPRRLWGGTFQGVRQNLPLYVQNLPQRGVYYFRVIPLSNRSRQPVGRFSNPAVLFYGVGARVREQKMRD